LRRLAPLLLLVPCAARPAADAVPNVNPRDLGMAQSLVAAQDGAAAAHGNPAALSRLEGLDLSVAVSMLDNATRWTTTTGLSPSPASSKFHPAPPPSIFAAWGGKLGSRGWGIGGGMTIPEGGNIIWPEGWAGREEIVKVDRKVFAFYLTGGIELIPQIRVGGGLVYYHTTEYLRQFYAAANQFAHVDDSGGAATFDLAAEVAPFAGVPLTLAVDFKHKVVQNLKGKAVFETSGVVVDPVTHAFTVPDKVEVGAAYRARPDLLFAFAWTRDRYHVYREDRFVDESGSPTPIPDVVVERNYGDANTFRGGVEVTLSPAWQVRAGLLRDLTGMKTRYFSPSLPDGDVWAGSAGASYRWGKGFGAHAGVFYARYDLVDTTGKPPAFPGKWRSSALIASLGVTWRPGAPAAAP
jgi:long-chain fatty acid transport protein